MKAFCLLILQKSSVEHLLSLPWYHEVGSFFEGGYDTGCSCFFSILFTDSHIYELFCLCLSLRRTIPGWDPCRWGGWTGLIEAERASGSFTGTLNITCGIVTTSGLPFSLCNWADNVPWFPLFCTSICSAWATRCILVSWKWSRVIKRSGNPHSLLQFCQRDLRGQSSSCVLGPEEPCCSLTWCNYSCNIRTGKVAFFVI